MELSLAGIFKLFAAANVIVIALLLFLAIKPLFGFGVFGIEVSGWRYAYGSGGWVAQHSKTYEVAATGFYPWYRWWFDRRYAKHFPAAP